MLTCSLCKNQYDSDQRLPKVIPTCGHTICFKCLSSILEMQQQSKECPECKIPFSLNAEKEWFQTNFALQRILEMMGNICKKHKSPKDQVCLIDYQNICVNCVQYDHDHHNHPVSSLQDVQIQAKRKIQEINKKEKDFNKKARGQIQRILQKSHDNMNDLIEKTIAKLKNDFAKKKRWLSWDIETLFALKKIKSIVTDSEIIRFKEENTSCCQKLSSNIINTDYLELLEKEIPQMPSYHQEQLREFSTKVEIKVGMKKTTIYDDDDFPQPDQSLHTGLIEIRSPQERLRIDLEIAKRRYFDLSFDENNTILTITPKESCQNVLEWKQSITTEQISNIVKISLNQEKAKFSDEMVYGLWMIWKNFSLNPIKEVALNYSQDTSDQDLILASQFPFWTEEGITKIHLNFKDCLLDQTPSFAQFISQNLVKLQGLKELHLFKQRTKHIDDTIINVLANQILPCLENLDTLCVWLNQTKVTDASIKKLFVQLKRLKALTLSLLDTQISDNSLFMLSTVAFNDSPHLEELNISLPQTQITHSGVSLLCANLSKLTKLRILSLALGEVNVSEAAIVDLTKNSLKSMPTLQELHIGFNNCQLSQESLQMLCRHLPKQLTHLQLGFFNECVIDQDIKTLAIESLQNMPNLSILGLRFFNTSLTQESLITLNSYLSQNTRIKNLVLDFTKAYLDDDSVCHFINQTVPSMPNLQYCQFYATNCPLINLTFDKIANLNSFYDS